MCVCVPRKLRHLDTGTFHVRQRRKLSGLPIAIARKKNLAKRVCAGTQRHHNSASLAPLSGFWSRLVSKLSFRLCEVLGLSRSVVNNWVESSRSSKHQGPDE